MQSTVVHPRHTASSRTPISSGDSVDAMKLNWPTGQTNLQNVAPVNVRSTSSATREIADDEPGGRRRPRPQVEQLVGEEDGDEQRERDPLPPQPPRPMPRRPMHPAPEIADEDHRTGAAEHVAGGEQRADQQAAIVDPRQHRRQVLRREVGPEQPVPTMTMATIRRAIWWPCAGAASAAHGRRGASGAGRRRRTGAASGDIGTGTAASAEGRTFAT